MRASEALAPIGPRLALLAMILAVVVSVRAGVENLPSVLRGIAAFIGTLWAFRLGAGILDALMPSRPSQAPEPAGPAPAANGGQGAAEREAQRGS